MEENDKNIEENSIKEDGILNNEEENPIPSEIEEIEESPTKEDTSSLDDSFDIKKEDIKEDNAIEEENDITSQNVVEEKESSLNISPIVEESEDEETKEVNELVTVRPIKFQEFENTPPVLSIKKNLDIMQDISMHVSVELGRTKSSIREVMELEKGSIVELEKIAGEQVEIYVNEKLVAKGEVIVIEDKFGVRVTSTSIAKPNQNM